MGRKEERKDTKNQCFNPENDQLMIGPEDHSTIYLLESFQ